MKTINGTKDLSVEKIIEFVQLANNNLVNINIEGMNIGSATLSNIADYLYVDEVKQYVLTNEIKIELVAPEVTLQFVGQDYNWYNENSRRRNKLRTAFAGVDMAKKKEEKQQEVKDEKKVYRIAIADISENGIENVDSIISSNKPELVRFINNKIVQHAKAESDDNMYVFNLDYQDGDENDIEKWSTLDDLVAQGKLVLK